MKPFAFTRAKDNAGAIELVSRQSGAKFLGGGTNLIDLMKLEVEQPKRLVDINRLPLDQIEKTADGLRIGALARNSDVARHPLVKEQYPLLAQAFMAGASPQLRNMATTGGNLLQRTRCYYFYDRILPCNKREPGSGCSALEGFNQLHAIFGASEHCIATHPSDMCVALAALEAVIQVEGPKGKRSIPMASFHRLPGDKPEKDTNLAADELIVAVDLPLSPYAAHSHYFKVRDRTSYAFALVSVAAALEMENGKIKSARLAMGGVAHKPWRLEEGEQALAGNEPGDELFDKVAKAVMQSAKPYAHNKFKVPLGRQTIIRALQSAAAGTQQMEYYIAQP